MIDLILGESQEVGFQLRFLRYRTGGKERVWIFGVNDTGESTRTRTSINIHVIHYYIGFMLMLNVVNELIV